MLLLLQISVKRKRLVKVRFNEPIKAKSFPGIVCDSLHQQQKTIKTTVSVQLTIDKKLGTDAVMTIQRHALIAIIAAAIIVTCCMTFHFILRPRPGPSLVEHESVLTSLYHHKEGTIGNVLYQCCAGLKYLAEDLDDLVDLKVAEFAEPYENPHRDDKNKVENIRAAFRHTTETLNEALGILVQAALDCSDDELELSSVDLRPSPKFSKLLKALETVRLSCTKVDGLVDNYFCEPYATLTSGCEKRITGGTGSLVTCKQYGIITEWGV